MSGGVRGTKAEGGAKGNGKNGATAVVTSPRERILAAALDLFFRQGFKGTSVREVTEACGLTPGALYNHFPSKEALLFAIISRAIDEGERRLAEALDRADDDPVSRLRAFVHASALYHTRQRAEGLVGMLEYHELTGEELQTIVTRRRRLRRTLEDILREGVEAGVFVIPAAGAPNALKMTATAIVNVAIRATEIFGPTAHWADEQVAEFHADLALQMLGVRLAEHAPATG